MDREQLISSAIYYVSSAAALTAAGLYNLLIWLAKRCDDADIYFTAISARHKK